MSVDLEMARGNVEGGYNLAVGEPVLLQKHLAFPPFMCVGPYSYPTMEGEKGLLKELRVLHPEGEIVVTNGAKQVLSAAFYALKEVEGRLNVVHNPPYWPSYLTLAKMQGMFFNQPESLPSYDIRVVTAPNNPDGGEEYGGGYDVWDAVYAHWVYGWSGQEPNHRIRVCSASKLLGMSGARVGWAVTKDPKLAAAMRRYVEFTTSGVSTPAQACVADALRFMRRPDICISSRYRDAREEMASNGRLFNRELGKAVQWVAGVPARGQGMFAWFSVKDEFFFAFESAIQRAKVALVSGLACGRGGGIYRMNMCHEQDYTRRALEAIKKEM